jgi:transcriptional regulator with PAS, ATPase and Fis domain
VARSRLPVLLLGESGTGKELFASAVHEASDRHDGPFVVVDCSGLPETLFESELFGHEKGAFTGAQHRKPGLVETASGGTLFLDEIGDVPLAMQVKLLRLIESGTFRRVGATETQQADFRLVAATHKPLQQMVAEGRFRQDLYYRIAAFPIFLPPLRDRAGDIPLLVDSFLQRGGKAAQRIVIQPAAMERLQAHDWPGNIRELRNVLERARLFADDGIVRPEDLPEWLNAPLQARPPAAPAATATAPDLDEQIRHLVAEGRLSRRDMAARLGLSERTLYRRLKALDLG